MTKTLTLALLAVSLIVLSPSLWQLLSEIAWGGMWIEAGILLLGFVAIVTSAIASRSSNANKLQNGVNSTALAVGVSLALLSTLWGWYSSDPVWVFRGWAVCLSAFLSLTFGFSKSNFAHLASLACFVPLSLWSLAPQIHSLGQNLATSFAGAVLDLLKIFFFTKGNVIGLVNTSFLENVQCSGLRLLGPALLIALIYSFLRGYRLARSIYMAVVCLFWVVVINGVRIAFFARQQDSQATPVDFNAPVADVLCLLAILFLLWSADQFYAAFTTKEVDRESEPAKAPAIVSEETLSSIVAVNVMLIGLILTGAMILYRKSAGTTIRRSSQEIKNAVENIKLPVDLDGWKAEDASVSSESIAPVFKHGTTWIQRDWELANQAQGALPMKLRLEGAWLRPPKIDWHWRWFGWRLSNPLIDERGQSSWSMTRSIVEEAFVVTCNIGVATPDPMASPSLQLSLIQQGYQTFSEEQRKSQRELFAKYRKEIEEQIRASNHAQIPH
jgi:exosortase/archaeosortase family protein